MKRTIKVLAVVLLSISLTSCATVFGGKITPYQRITPGDGQPQRDVRVAALIFDIILFWPGTIVDFATGAIYKPEQKK